MTEAALAKQLRKLSIRDRVAIALVMLERNSSERTPRDEQIGAAIDILWGFVELPSVAEWDTNSRDRDALMDLLDATAVAGADASKAPDTARSVALVDSACREHLYRAVEDDASESAALIARALMTIGVNELPKFVKLCSFDKRHPFGPAQRRDVYRRIL